jgi:NAD(P)-dependent dehydrogenase (short-subunit alcohol dehydrogenase family)
MSNGRRPLVLVTGASGSIGMATLACLRDRGADVVTADRAPLPPEGASLAQAELTVDLSEDSEVERAFGEIPQTGELRHVIAIAGGGDLEELRQPDPAVEPLDVFNRVVVQNLHIAFVTIRHAVPLLRHSSGERSITLVGSINALGGYAAPGYSAAKAGLSGLTSALAAPLGQDGIRINCLALGTVDTDNLRRLATERGHPLDLQSVAKRSALGRVLTPAEVAVALVGTAFDMPGLTGSTIVLDNGQTLTR